MNSIYFWHWTGSKINPRNIWNTTDLNYTHSRSPTPRRNEKYGKSHERSYQSSFCWSENETKMIFSDIEKHWAILNVRIVGNTRGSGNARESVEFPRKCRVLCRVFLSVFQKVNSLDILCCWIKQNLRWGGVMVGLWDATKWIHFEMKDNLFVVHIEMLKKKSQQSRYYSRVL